MSPKMQPVPDINGGFTKLATAAVGQSVPVGWQFLPSASGEESWVVDSVVKMSGAHSVRASCS